MMLQHLTNRCVVCGHTTLLFAGDEPIAIRSRYIPNQVLAVETDTLYEHIVKKHPPVDYFGLFLELLSATQMGRNIDRRRVRSFFVEGTDFSLVKRASENMERSMFNILKMRPRLQGASNDHVRCLLDLVAKLHRKASQRVL